MKNRTSMFIMALMVLSAAAATFSFSKTTQPKESSFRVDKAKVDLGNIKAGTDAVATFVFKNSGDVPVKILRAKPS